MGKEEIALLTPLFAAFGYGLKVLFDKMARGKGNNWPDTFRSVSKVLDNLRDAVENGGARRAVVLIMENGGGKPELGRQLYSSVLYESFQEGMQPIHANWQKRPIDGQYLENFRKVYHASGRYHVFKADDFRGSILHGIYKKENVECSQVAEIYRSNKFYIYVSINYCETYNEISDDNKTRALQILANLQDIFKNFKK